MFIEEIGRELYGRMLDIWLGRSGESPEFEELYRQHWRSQAKIPLPHPATCLHRSETHARLINCKSCNNSSVKIKVYGCAIYGECTLGKQLPELTCCQGCPSKVTKETQMRVLPKSPIQWAYGVTTVPSRRADLLPRTLQSLCRAGFDAPRLFVDNERDAASWEKEFGLEVTAHYPRIYTYGNWLLTLWELYIRNPKVDRYAIFQDDLVTCANLRQYLEAVPFPTKGYWNLYTFPRNQQLSLRGRDGKRIHSGSKLGEDGVWEVKGFYPSDQRGKGAVALIFDRAGVMELLTSRVMAERPQSGEKNLPKRGPLGVRNVDGGVITALSGRVGYTEYVHNPSLVQHTGRVSSMGNPEHQLAVSFPGEEFDCLQLLTPSGEYPERKEESLSEVGA